ncbi:MAG: 50S ribosomal protein L19 [Bacteroidales bacterium]|nr:50S ribosomal protein L19 [Bacteroidales bacterium]MCF0201598.1 50S ribosomal protein L19 [Bacteroidales bacterium]
MSKNSAIQFIEDQIVVKDFPKFRPGDTITVTYKIVEGEKSRLQKFQGIVLKRSGCGKTATFTVRKISNGIGVERCFPIASPMIDNIELNKEGIVRRARIYYLRGLRGKKARIKEARH